MLISSIVKANMGDYGVMAMILGVMLEEIYNDEESVQAAFSRFYQHAGNRSHTM